jgi:anhydro-N-acetylmuramic acid kinase
MHTIEALRKKRKKSIIGLMSGTSADGIDAALIEVRGSGPGSSLRRLAFRTYPYPPGFKAFLMKNSDASSARLEDITRLDMLVAMLFADAARAIARSAGKTLSDIDLIGSHGQTIQHLPLAVPLFGKKVRSTLQIGNPSAIATLTGVTTVGDFRVADIAAGGSGAPLVPLFDYLTLRSRGTSRAALNIGGIANITVLPASSRLADIMAFDTGPGNMLIDMLMQKLFKKPMDRDGRTASAGRILSPLLGWMHTHPFLMQRPPKSTGRETFGEMFARRVLARARGARPRDIVATASEFTALSIYTAYLAFIRPKGVQLEEIFVSGGGVHNCYLMDALRRYFSGARVQSTASLGLPPDAKEAMCFALLANETIAGHPGNVPRATGARRPALLGAICLPLSPAD